MYLVYKIIRIIHHHKIHTIYNNSNNITYSTYVTYVHTVLLKQFILQLRKILYIDNSTHHYVELSQTGHIEV